MFNLLWGLSRKRVWPVMMVTILALPALYPSQVAPAHAQEGSQIEKINTEKAADWRRKWERYIVASAADRQCYTDKGEELAWCLGQFLKGFYFGYEATRDPKWVQALVNWTDAWLSQAVIEPDGFPGWPKEGAAGTPVDGLDAYYADSLLGEAMAFLSIIRLSREILEDPHLTAVFGEKARGYIRLSVTLFKKWDQRGAWRHADGGGLISVVLPYGIDRNTGGWTSGYVTRNAPGQGHSHPDNKANWVASWLLAMSDATGESIYKERAAAWFRLMKSRMKAEDDGTYRIWNYWEPGGPWDYLESGIPKHWIGVHPNDGYYDSDVRAIVAAYEAGIVFERSDIDRLVATAIVRNRRWTALVPYSPKIQRRFEEEEDPSSWPGIWEVPWYLALQAGRLSPLH